MSIELRNLFGTNESEYTRHRVFISYHHENDEKYKEAFEKDFGDLFINESVQDGEYDSELSDGYVKRLIREDKISLSTVVVVLIGSETYKRKHVDWEIYAGLTEKAGGHSGLIGIILPSYYDNPVNKKLKVGKYYDSTIPARLNDNIKTKYAKIYKWEDASRTNNSGEYYIKDWINAAFDRKNNESDKIENSRLQMEENLE